MPVRDKQADIQKQLRHATLQSRAAVYAVPQTPEPCSAEPLCTNLAECVITQGELPTASKRRAVNEPYPETTNMLADNKQT